MKTSRTIIAAMLAGGALMTATAAFAQVDNGMIHGPAVQQNYGEPHMMKTAVVINLGWHGDRYWDGHRYWQRDEWMRHHPHDAGPRHAPPHADRHDDHRHG
ncbi:hypothetical protein [Caballeronia sp. dw_276]|uniref:hypothetical protein n=1 Tax=Caballeronia sp. dw_276 TaxID=2719795 RepID=UPI002101EA81|nr:hypothetical protein [Caballeronia sp. dw_276]